MITTETVNHLARLSRLRFDSTELEHFTHDLDDIFNYATLISTIDPSSLESEANKTFTSTLSREDRVSAFPEDTLLNNAPLVENHAFKVPRIIA